MHPANMTGDLPHLLICASPSPGHTKPMLNIASELIGRGFSATFIAGAQFENDVEKIGAEYILLPFPSMSPMPDRSDAAAMMRWRVMDFCVKATTYQWELTKKTLEEIRERKPTSSVVVLTESLYMGVNPLSLGAPLPRGYTERPRVININALPVIVSSKDTAPFGMGLPPDSSEEGQARNKLLLEKIRKDVWEDHIVEEGKIMAQLGASKWEPKLPFDNWMTIHEKTLQMCPPSLEYPRSDLHPSIAFAGAIDAHDEADASSLPSWWTDVEESGKKIVVVSQGTVATDYTDLIIPTMRALANSTDLVLITILGRRGSALPTDIQVPSNTRVVDYLPYDVILPRANVFVFNAGYGGLIHSIRHGVPMVVAGDSEDKPEVAMRAQYSGIALNLKTGKPNPEDLRTAVDEILQDRKYKDKVMAMSLENRQMRALDFIEQTIVS